MTTTTAARRAVPAPRAVPEGSWPHDVSHDPCLKIGEVRSILAEEFPLLTLSKIRHYESIELIHPHRTTSNQRLFSHADAERLRFILREQRDRYLPLEQIRELLRQLDAGEQPEGTHPGRMRVIDESTPRPQPGTRLKLAEVSGLTGVPVADIESMVAAGILSTDARGRLTSQAPDIVRFASMLTASVRFAASARRLTPTRCSSRTLWRASGRAGRRRRGRGPSLRPPRIRRSSRSCTGLSSPRTSRSSSGR